LKVDGDTATCASDASVQDLSPFFPNAGFLATPVAAPAAVLSPRTVAASARRARRAAAVAAVEAQLRVALGGSGQAVTAAGLALALAAEEELEASLEEDDVDTRGVA
jgi:hypothetical protein